MQSVRQPVSARGGVHLPAGRGRCARRQGLRAGLAWRRLARSGGGQDAKMWLGAVTRFALVYVFVAVFVVGAIRAEAVVTPPGL